MQHDQFIGLVQDRLPSRGAAEGATRAALETLGERVPESRVAARDRTDEPAGSQGGTSP